MTPEQLDAIIQAINSDSVRKILLGAVLALAGGFFAKIWDEWRTERKKRHAVFSFAIDVLDSYVTTFSELVELQGQTGTIWINIIERMLEEYPVFARNREHLIVITD